MQKQLFDHPIRLSAAERHVHTAEQMDRLDSVYLYAYPLQDAHCQLSVCTKDVHGTERRHHKLIEYPCFSPVLVLNGLTAEPLSEIVAASDGDVAIFGYFIRTNGYSEKAVAAANVIVNHQILGHESVVAASSTAVNLCPRTPVSFITASEAGVATLRLGPARAGTVKHVVLQRSKPNACCRLVPLSTIPVTTLGHATDLRLERAGDTVTLLSSGPAWVVLHSERVPSAGLH